MIDIPDMYVKTIILSAIGKELTPTVKETPVTKYDMEKVTSLTFLNSNRVYSLEGLQYAGNLQTLRIESFSSSVNFELLKDLTNLKEVYIKGDANGKLSSINFMDKFYNLTDLSLPENNISDISVLKNKTNLTNLILNGSPISNESVKVIGNLKNLNQLNIGYTGINDYTWITQLSKLSTLYVNNNKLSDLNVQPISQLTQLYDLYIYNNNLTDLRIFKNMKSTHLIQAAGNKISDLAPLLEFSNVQQLNLNNNLITDLTPLSQIASGKISYLDVGRNGIKDFSPLYNIKDDDINIQGYGQTINLEAVHLKEGQLLSIENPLISIDGSPLTPFKFYPDFGVYDAKKILFPGQT